MRLKQICNFDPLTGAERQAGAARSPTWRRWPTSGRKAIVFSQWVEPLEVLAKALAAVRPAAVPRQGPARTQRHADPRPASRPTRTKHVILMSYGTGSVGLNLQFTELRVPVRPLVEPGRRGPGDQPGPPHRAEGPGVRDAVRQPRTRSRAGSPRCWRRSGKLFNELIAQNGPPPALGLTEDEIFGLFDIRSRPKKASHEPVVTIPFSRCDPSGVNATSVARLSERPCEMVNS